MTKRVHVAVGIIKQGPQILLAKRHGHLHQGGKWEFPGGKVEDGESTAEALIRELKEEIDLNVSSSIPFMQISHDYHDKQVFLDIHLVQDFSGSAKGMEGQEVAWVKIENLSELEFPDANAPIVEKIQQELA